MTDGNPKAVADGVRQRVEAVLNEHIRPAVGSDGAELELVDVDDLGIVQVRFRGTCLSCPSTVMVIIMDIEHELKTRVPEVRYVEAVP